MLKMMVVGATSAIAHETIKHFAADGAELFLVARNAAKLAAIENDLKVRGAARVESMVLDMNALDQHAHLLHTMLEKFGALDVLLVAHGTLSDQEKAQADFDYAMQELNTNFISTASLLTLVANHMEAQKRGSIAVISSVAGDRGRGSNYVYGTAMAAKSAFVSGLRNRLAKSGVSVLTIKPGFVDTPMTADLPKNPLFADPASVGKAIYQAMKAGKSEIYVPFYWRYIMLIIKSIPEAIFKRLSL